MRRTPAFLGLGLGLLAAACSGGSTPSGGNAPAVADANAPPPAANNVETMTGATLAQLPKHSLSLWNRYDFTPRIAAALGILSRSDVFTSTDNTVVLPSWTRIDAAFFYNLTSTVRAQVNVEILFDENYFLNAHSNTNITPGSPRAFRVALTTRF